MDPTNFKTPIAMTIQHTIQKLGPIPDDLDKPIRDIIDGKDLAAFLALGCYLEEAYQELDYGKLREGLGDIKRGQEALAAKAKA